MEGIKPKMFNINRENLKEVLSHTSYTTDDLIAIVDDEIIDDGNKLCDCGVKAIDALELSDLDQTIELISDLCLRNAWYDALNTLKDTIAIDGLLGVVDGLVDRVDLITNKGLGWCEMVSDIAIVVDLIVEVLVFSSFLGDRVGELPGFCVGLDGGLMVDDHVAGGGSVASGDHGPIAIPDHKTKNWGRRSGINAGWFRKNL